MWQDYLPCPPWHSFSALGSAFGPSVYFSSYAIYVYFFVCVMLVNDFLSDTIFQVMKILQVTHRTVFYQMITINPGMYKVTHTATVVQGEGWWSPPPPPWGFVLLQQCEINLHWLHSPELALQVDTIFYWLHV